MLIRPAFNLIKASQLVHDIPRMYEAKRKQLSLGIAWSLLSTIRRHLRLQDLDWEPLAVGYKAWKDTQGLDTRIWIARGDLTKLIKIIKVPYKNSHIYLVGIDPFEKHYSGMSAYQLAMIHEYGVPDLGIPARPLFRPSYHEVAAKYKAKAMTANPSLYKKYFQRSRRL